MPIQANSSGTVTGSFTIPENVRTGTREFRVQGNGGSWGRTSYFADGVIANAVMQQVFVTTISRYDPLAQTFTLPEGRMIGGVDLKFCAKGGANDVRVQIRETQVGIPTQDILCEAIIPHTAIVTTDSWVRATFPVPAVLLNDREYAIVLLTDDAAHKVAIAELGKSATRPDGSWVRVTAQAYQIGVLLSSSNASTWTPHQTMDLCFRLLACKFTASQRTIDFGTLPAVNASDIMVNASVQRTAADTDVRFGFTPQGGAGEEYTVNESAPVPLASRVTDTVEARAYLSGNDKWSPVLWGDWLVLLGNQAATSDYVSRVIRAALAFNATIIFEALQPGVATVGAQVATARVTGGVDVVNGDGVYQYDWVDAALVSSEPIGDGWFERKFQINALRGVGLDRETRVKLNLAGTTRDRPAVRNLRVIIK